jgi:hypothetical protein
MPEAWRNGRVPCFYIGSWMVKGEKRRKLNNLIDRFNQESNQVRAGLYKSKN